MTTEKKEGVELIIDRVEALRVRVVTLREKHAIPPTTAGDERLIDTLLHWEQLIKETLAEATAMKLRNEYEPLQNVYNALDRISALMALPKETPAAEIASMVKIAMDRLQQLEIRVANFTDAATPAMGSHVAHIDGRTSDREAYLRAGVAAGILDEHDVLFNYAPYERAARPPLSTRATTPTHVPDVVIDEPRPSYVLERMEGLVLGGWLEDATKNLERVSEYMAANEERMSEDVFDELKRTADKLGAWAQEIKRGNMFPRSL